MEGELKLAAEVDELRRARRYVESVFHDLGLEDSGDSLYETMLAVNEAVANAIEHGAPCEKGQIFVRACVDGEWVVFEVHDCGRFGLPSVRAEDRKDRGRGIPLMNVLMDEVNLEAGDDGTTVRLRRRITAAA